jgi:PIN domain nuclease of toxin-antitoxin system
VCEEAFARDELAISTVTYHELADLVRKRRLNQQVELERWRRELLSMGVLEMPVSGAVAIRASALEDFHKDPWDRMISATALVHDASLVTADRVILAWTGVLNCINARK